MIVDKYENWVGSNAKRKTHIRSVMFVSAPKRSCCREDGTLNLVKMMKS